MRLGARKTRHLHIRLISRLDVVVAQPYRIHTGTREPLCWNNMSERAKACWRKANQCERAATLASDERLRLMYSALAEQWQASASGG
jgi:hypothetical protein